MAEHNVCPHASDTWEREPALYSSRCPECKDRVCTRCRRYGSEDGGLPLVSWMTGLCKGCYAEVERHRKIRDQYEHERDARQSRGRVWDDGRAAAPDAENPYGAPTYYEQRLLDEHDWLRDEAQR